MDAAGGQPNAVVVDVQEPVDEWQPPRIHRVHPQLRGSKQVYEPAVLSLGPYHYGKPQFCQAEKFKLEVFNMFVSGSKVKDDTYFYNLILERIREIRGHYEDVEWDDPTLAGIILRDSCFVIQWTDDPQKVTKDIINRLGTSMAVLMSRDMYMLENQIPYCVIKQLCEKRYDKYVTSKLLSTLYFDLVSGTEVEPENSCRKLSHKPFHILEAYRTQLIGPDSATAQPSAITAASSSSVKKPPFLNLTDHCPFHSAAYLIKKGIDFKPLNAYTCNTLFCGITSSTTNASSTASSMRLKEIKFSTGICGGTLELPAYSVNKNTMAVFSNIIALEMSPGNEGDYTVTSYVNLMKSLIETPEDVNVLQERGILHSSLGNDDEVVNVFDEIETFGVGDSKFLAEVIESVSNHCNNHGKTWMADLIHKYFNSPWSVIALLAATLLLCLTFLQTFFTIRPVKDK